MQLRLSWPGFLSRLRQCRREHWSPFQEKELDNKKIGPNTENPKTKCPQRSIAGNSAKPLCVTTGQVTKIYSEISIAIFFR